MKAALWNAIALCSLCSAVGRAQTADSAVTRAQRIGIGSTSEEVARQYGDQRGYYWRGRTYEIAPITDEPVYVVYGFVDQGNEYELRIRYYADNSESRLHPASRVMSITMIADKPISVSAGLQRMPGAARFCAAWCKTDRLIPGLELLLTPSSGKRAFFAWTIEAYMNTPAGDPIPDAMRDLDSMATVFILSLYDYTKLPITRSVKQEWAP